MTQHAEFLARYKHLRQVGFHLNTRLVKTLSRSALDEGGNKLGILQGNALTLDSEDEIAVLMDYCLHDVRRQGANAIEHYLAKSPPAADADEMVLLQALRRAWFSLFAVVDTEPGVGVRVRDLLRDEEVFIFDVGFSQSASVGMVLAFRVMAPEGIAMTTGAPLPLGVLSTEARAGLAQGLVTLFNGADLRNLSPEQASELSAAVLRTCLQMGAAEHIKYVEPKAQRSTRLPPATSPAGPARRVGRNDPCPCGSGKKFKHCCGTRR